MRNAPLWKAKIFVIVLEQSLANAVEYLPDTRFETDSMACHVVEQLS
jgi:hypothetical protein